MKVKEAFQLSFPPSLETVASPPNCTPITLPTLQAKSCWMPEHTFLRCFILDLMQQPTRVEKSWIVHVNFRFDIFSLLTASCALVGFSFTVALLNCSPKREKCVVNLLTLMFYQTCMTLSKVQFCFGPLGRVSSKAFFFFFFQRL